MSTNNATTTRTELLEAANRVVLAHGAVALTLEAVARAAGVSKGGLLYHFPSKAALVNGMIDHLLDTFEDTLRREMERDLSDAPGRWLRAYVRATFASDEITQVSTALLAAVSTHPELITAKRDRLAAWQQHTLNDGIDPMRANTIRFAADGLWMNDLFGLSPLDVAQRAQFAAALIALTHGDAP